MYLKYIMVNIWYYWITLSEINAIYDLLIAFAWADRELINSFNGSVFLSIILEGKALRSTALFFLTSQIIPGMLVRGSWIEGWISLILVVLFLRILASWVLSLSWIIHNHFFVSIAEIMTRGCTKLHARCIIFIFILKKLTFSFVHFLYPWWL